MSVTTYEIDVRLEVDAATKEQASEIATRILSAVFNEPEVLTVEADAPRFVPVKGTSQPARFSGEAA